MRHVWRQWRTIALRSYRAPYSTSWSLLGLEESHDEKAPRLHDLHWPHAMSNAATTRSPTCQPARDRQGRAIMQRCSHGPGAAKPQGNFTSLARWRGRGGRGTSPFTCCMCMLHGRTLTCCTSGPTASTTPMNS